MDALLRGFEDYIKQHKKDMTAKKNISDNIKTNKTAKTWKQKWDEKQLSGNIKQQTGKVSHEKTWTWLRKWKP